MDLLTNSIKFMRKILFLSSIILLMVSCSKDGIIEQRQYISNSEIPSDVKYYASKEDFEAK